MEGGIEHCELGDIRHMVQIGLNYLIGIGIMDGSKGQTGNQPFVSHWINLDSAAENIPAMHEPVTDSIDFYLLIFKYPNDLLCCGGVRWKGSGLPVILPIG
jgi:hypothetical protein